MKRSDLVVLLTDFGARDAYAGMLKGVLLGIHRHATIVDLTHEIDPQDVVGAAHLLRGAYRAFPAGAIFVCVVDPGVGTSRRILAAETDAYTFLAPDNGLLGFLQEEKQIRRVVEVTNADFFRSEISHTFHGRDILAPVAGHLCTGLDLKHLGPAVTKIATLGLPAPEFNRKGEVEGRVIRVDRFGNLTTNIPRALLKPFGNRAQVVVGARRVGPIRRTYGEAPPGTPLALIDSSGFLEIAVNCGDAARTLKARTGMRVLVCGRGRI